MRAPRILHVLHGGGGGVEASVRLLVEQTADAFGHLLLFARPDGWFIQEPKAGSALARVRWPVIGGLRRVIDGYEIDLCHMHHWIGSRRRLLRACRGLPVPLLITAHDFYLACPRVHLVPPGGVYCGAPEDTRVCQQCLAASPAVKQSVRRWRNDHAQFLGAAKAVLAPSFFVSDVLSRFFPAVNARVVPHASRPAGAGILSAFGERVISVGVVGALGPEKGGDAVEALAAAARRRGLPLRVVVLGDTHRHGGPASLYDGYLFVHGSYRCSDLPGLLQQYRIALAAFPARGPESFSLTLSEVWACGIPALVPPFGALAERVNATGGGWIVGDFEAPDAWLDTIMALLDDLGAVRTASTRARTAIGAVDPSASAIRAVYREVLAGVDDRAAKYD